MEVRSFFRLLNRSSWHLRYKFFSTEVQNLKFLWCEAEILRKLVKKNLELGSQYFLRYDLWKVVLFQAPEFHLKKVIVEKFQ